MNAAIDIEAGDTVQLNYNGPGPDPVFEVSEVEDEYFIHLSNGATVYPQHFERGRFEVVQSKRDDEK